MATVEKGLLEDPILNNKYKINIHESYYDGNILKRLCISIFAYMKFLTIYKNYDLFHIHMASYGSTFRKGYYIRFLKRHGKKVVLHIHGAEYLLFYDKLSERKKVIVNSIWNKSDATIVLSEEWKEQFNKIFHLNNLIVVNNGIDTEQFISARCDVIKNRYIFLLLGHLGKRKGTYDIIDAVARLHKKYPELKVIMAGDGEVDKVKELVNKKKLQSNIEVVGWVDFEGKIEIMKKIGTILLPSYNEGLPMTILEGMAAAKVVISTNVGGIPEVVKDGINGVIISPGNIDALCEAMEKVMLDIEFDKKCAYKNLDVIDSTFSRKIMHKRIDKVFELVIGS